jgi:hypothetical protein
MKQTLPFWLVGCVAALRLSLDIEPSTARRVLFICACWIVGTALSSWLRFRRVNREASAAFNARMSAEVEWVQCEAIKASPWGMRFRCDLRSGHDESHETASAAQWDDPS